MNRLELPPSPAEGVPISRLLKGGPGGRGSSRLTVEREWKVVMIRGASSGMDLACARRSTAGETREVGKAHPIEGTR